MAGAPRAASRFTSGGFISNTRTIARGVTAMAVYVSTSVNLRKRTEVSPGAGEPEGSEPASRRTEVTKTGGADRSPLLPVCLEGRERPCLRTVSLRAKRDDREHPNWNAPALIAGQI